MLILSRRVGETIRITDKISIRIEHAKPSGVSIGVDAPKSVCVVREEARPLPAGSGEEPRKRK